MRTTAIALVLIAGAPAFATQGTLYDGALDPAAGYTFATTAAGYQISVKQPAGPICDPPGDPLPITIEAGPVAMSPARTDGVLVDPEVIVISVSPDAACPTLDEAGDDCELLASGKAPACIASIKTGAQLIHDEITACVGGACDDYASLVNLINGAPPSEIPQFAYGSFCPVGSLSPSLDYLGEIGLWCDAGVINMRNLYWELKYFGYQRDYCNLLAKQMEQLRNSVKNAIQLQGGLHDNQRECYLHAAEGIVDHLTSLKKSAKKKYTQISDDPVTSCDPDVLKASCDECDGYGGFSPPAISDWVRQSIGSSEIEPLIQTFGGSANASRDLDEAGRLSRIAARLASVPRDQIIEFSFPTDAPIPSANVALRAEGDRRWPEVVVLRPYPRDPRQTFTHADRAALEDGYALFRYALAR